MKKGRLVMNIAIDFEYELKTETDDEKIKQWQKAVAETIKTFTGIIPLVRFCSKKTTADTMYNGVWECKEE